MLLPHFLPAQCAPVLQWSKDHNWLITWSCINLRNTLNLKCGFRAMSFTLPVDAQPSEWEAILTTWQQQNDPSQQHLRTT